jgi:RNA polymerase sigma factor (sigma-70 family)
MLHRQLNRKERLTIESLEEWVSAVQSGHTQEYAHIVQAYQRQIYIYCFRMLGNEQEAEDMVQDVLVQGYISIHSYKPTASFSAWLYKIAYHLCLNILRKRKFQFKVSWLFRSDAVAESPEQIIVNNAFSPPLANAINSLSPQEQGLLILRVFEDKSFTEIGQIVGKSPDAVKKKLMRIKNKVRLTFDKWEETEWIECQSLMKTRI